MVVVNFALLSKTSIFIANKNSTLILTRTLEKCLCADVASGKRHKAKWNSRFPKADGVTRLEKLAEKLNPPPSEREHNVPLPADMGTKIDSTNQIFSSYIPLEKKNSLVSRQGLGQRWESFKAMLMSTYGVAMIKRKVKPFKAVDFSKIAQQKFIDVNTALQKNDRHHEEIMKEHATLMIIRALKSQFQNPGKTLYWKFVQEIDRPRIVHARVASIFEKDNLFAQVTVRLHTEQILAVKDRYNRTLTGDATKGKRVIDYVVFERHLNDPYGRWRICGKLNHPKSNQKALATSSGPQNIVAT